MARAGRPRARDHLDEIAYHAARGIPATSIAAEIGLTYRQVRSRINSIRRDLVSETGDPRWLEEATLVECGREFLRLRSLPLPP